MPASKLTAASEVQRIAAYNWPLAVELAFNLGVVGVTDLEVAFATGHDVLELCGFAAPAAQAVAWR
jgi:hypothetical protein